MLSASCDDDKIAWYENLGGPGLLGFSVSLTPLNPPIIIPSGGGHFQFDCEAKNNDSLIYTFDGWLKALLPGGGSIEPIALRTSLTLIPGDSMFWDNITQYVPASAHSGEYTYIANAGFFADSVIASDSFTFQKLAGDGSPVHDLGWAVYGWGEDSPAILNSQFSILNCSPNPFNPSTTISFDLPQAGNVSLTVYDITGREVAKLVDGCFQNAGLHSITFDGSNLASGIYFARLQAGEFVKTRKLLLVK